MMLITRSRPRLTANNIRTTISSSPLPQIALTTSDSCSNSIFLNRRPPSSPTSSLITGNSLIGNGFHSSSSSLSQNSKDKNRNDLNENNTSVSASTTKVDKLKTVKNLVTLQWDRIIHEQIHPQSPIKPYLMLMRLDKPIGTWLLLWPCFWSIALAQPMVSVPYFALMLTYFSVGAVVMRGAGCTINDLWDRNFDRLVERTKDRPLASGAVTVPKAIAFLAAQLSIGLAVLLQLNSYSVMLGAGSLAFVVIYPLMKRVTYWPQVFLGLAFNWGALLGYAAVSGSALMNWYACLPLYIAGICWTLCYDTIYAHQDKKDDVTAGVKSTALRFGDKTKLWLSGFALAFGAFLVISGLMADYSITDQWPFYASVAAATAHVFYQIFTVDYNNARHCHRMFVSNKWVGAILFLGILAANYMLKDEHKQEMRSRRATANEEETIHTKLSKLYKMFNIGATSGKASNHPDKQE